MSKRILAAIFSLGAVLASGSVCAMSSPTTHCKVVGGDKLPSVTGGPTEVCRVIEAAIRSAAPGLAYSAEINVLSKSAIKAVVVSKGRTIADEQLSVLDRDLNPRSIENFAKALAASAAKATKV